MRKRIDKGEFEKTPIKSAHPYKKGFMVFTENAIFYVSEEKAKKKKKKGPKR